MIHVTEYRGQRDGVPLTPALASYCIEVEEVANFSPAFKKNTGLIRFVADEDCFVDIGENADADENSEMCITDLPEYRVVVGGHRLSVVEA